jgi:type 1 glutamine amidotransferase
MSCKHFIVSLLLLSFAARASAAEPKKVLLLSQKRDHPPGSHEYHSGAQVLAKCLQGVPGLQVTVADADEPCPDGPKLINATDAVVLYVGEGGRWMQLDPKRLEAINRLTARGGGIIGLHWGIGAKEDKYVARHVELMGGMHGGADRKYVVKELDVQTINGDHPINAGVELKRLDDEYYYRLKFAKQGKVTPLLQTTIDGNAETIAWAFERPDGGRSFGFGGMHFHKNWQLVGCRRLVAQGILWTLKLPIPKEGLPVEVTEDDLKIR